MLRRIIGSKWDEVTGEWRRLHNEERYALYSSPNIIRVIKSRRLRWAGRVASMGYNICVYRILVGKSEKTRLFGRPRHRWEGIRGVDNALFEDLRLHFVLQYLNI